jgi:hypothetical protein
MANACTVMLFIVYKTLKYQYNQEKVYDIVLMMHGIIFLYFIC